LIDAPLYTSLLAWTLEDWEPIHMMVCQKDITHTYALMLSEIDPIPRQHISALYTSVVARGEWSRGKILEGSMRGVRSESSKREVQHFFGSYPFEDINFINALACFF
jgi:hypothetical protein